MNASPPDRRNDDPWDELEHGFFAGAPPDVPEPPPEPMCFDDLDPIVPAPAPWPDRFLARSRVLAAEGRRTLQAAARAAYRKGRPALETAWRRSRLLSAEVGRRALRLSLALGRRSLIGLAALRLGARNHRLIAAGGAALIVVMGISAVVVASRDNGRPTPAGVPLAVAGRPAIAGERMPAAAISRPAPEPEVLASEVAAAVATASLDPIASEAAPPPRPRRKHVKAPARHPARAHVAKPANLTKTAKSAKPAKPAKTR